MERQKEKKKDWQTVPYMTDFFGGQMPEMTDVDRHRLEKIYPQYKDNDSELKKLFLRERVNEAVQRNFEKIKNDVKKLVDREFERTRVFAERDKARRKAEGLDDNAD